MIQTTRVTTEQELLEALRHQTDEILIGPDLVAKIKTLQKAALRDTDELGSNVGSRGFLSVVTYGLNKWLKTYQGRDAADSEINERVLSLYKILADDGTLKLRLKQLDY